MSIIDNTYFKGRINIPAISGSGATDTVTGDTVTTTFIPLYETEYLKKALGYNMWKAFTEALAGTPATKWTDLRDGVDYTVGDVTYRWNGFKNSEKVSPIAYYVYCEYMSEMAVKTTAQGAVVDTKQNSTGVSSAQKISIAWAEMNKLNESLYHFLNSNIDTYTEFKINQTECFGSRNVFSI